MVLTGKVETWSVCAVLVGAVLLLDIDHAWLLVGTAIQALRGSNEAFVVASQALTTTPSRASAVATFISAAAAMAGAHLRLTTEVEAGLLLATWVRAGLADHIDHARLLVCAAVEATLAAIVVEVGLLHAVLEGAVAAGDIDHAFCLVLAAVQPVCVAWVVAGWVLAALRQQALPVPDVDIDHAGLLVRAAGDGMRSPGVVEVGVLLASRVAAQLVHDVHHVQLLVCAAEEAALLARSVEVGPGLAVWGCAAALHAHHGTCWPFHTAFATLKSPHLTGG